MRPIPATVKAAVLAEELKARTIRAEGPGAGESAPEVCAARLQWGQELYMRLARAAVAYEAAGKAVPGENDWIAQRRDKIAGAEKILSLLAERPLLADGDLGCCLA